MWKIEKDKDEVEGLLFRQRYQTVNASMSITRKQCKGTAFDNKKISEILFLNC